MGEEGSKVGPVTVDHLSPGRKGYLSPVLSTLLPCAVLVEPALLEQS